MPHKRVGIIIKKRIIYFYKKISYSEAKKKMFNTFKIMRRFCFDYCFKG